MYGFLKVLGLQVACFLFACVAFAAQDSTIVSDNSPIHRIPSDQSEIIEYLPMGLEVRVSSNALSGGWYKVRSKTGIYGWVHERFLSVKKEEEKVAEEEKQKEPKDDGKPKPERDRKWFIRAMFGFSFMQPGDLNDIFRFDELNTGYAVGTEMGMFLSHIIAFSLRLEALSKDVVAKEKDSGFTYNASIRSYPIMAGFDFFFLKLPSLRLSFGIFGGVAYSTTFSTEAINLSLPNTFVLKSTPFTSYARLNVTRPLGRIFSVFAEVGYRYLRTEAIGTSGAADINGGVLYLRSGVYQSRTIDLSGPQVAAGLGVHF